MTGRSVNAVCTERDLTWPNNVKVTLFILYFFYQLPSSLDADFGFFTHILEWQAARDLWISNRKIKQPVNLVLDPVLIMWSNLK